MREKHSSTVMHVPLTYTYITPCADVMANVFDRFIMLNLVKLRTFIRICCKLIQRLMGPATWGFYKEKYGMGEVLPT